MERKEFVLTPTGRLLDISTLPFKEFDGSSWTLTSKPVSFSEIDPREDDIEFFSDETSALKALKSCSSNNHLK